jgi:hypothetical protein
MIKKFENLNFLLDFNIASFAVKISLPMVQEIHCLETTVKNLISMCYYLFTEFPSKSR